MKRTLAIVCSGVLSLTAAACSSQPQDARTPAPQETRTATQARTSPVAGARNDSAASPVPGAGEARRDAAADVDRASLREQANEMGEAFVAGDFGRVADATLPALVERQGGRDKLIATFEREVGGARNQNIEFESFVAGEPTQVIEAGGKHYAVVPTTLRIKTPRGTAKGESFLIAASEDGGRNWKFVDGSGATDERMLRALLPDAADKLTLPARKAPTLEGASQTQ